ncbi:hypothetical protein NF212_24605 [Parasalinivibrio latis]|uniref:hypothetical protein n=1 Tax=Parasalinivibrio latis TaxID=2952610 RepID=UPI0030E0402B
MNAQTATMATASLRAEKRVYAVSFKGLIHHFKDVMARRKSVSNMYSLNELPDHIKRDIGLIR